MSIANAWPWLTATLHFALAIWVTIHAVLNKRDTRAAIGWTGLAWLAPIIGSIAYFCLGVNRIHRKAAKLGLQDALSQTPQIEIAEEEKFLAIEAARSYPNFAALAAVGNSLSDATLVPGNQIDCLIDGDQTYPAMIEAINQAERSISLLTYIFDSDRAGEEILSALKDAQSRSVEIRVLVDHVGGAYSKVKIVQKLQDLGIPSDNFLPTKFGHLPLFANLRNHRKILVVDGNIGFTGGTNIREAHWLKLDPDYPTQCLHFRLKGPVVAHVQKTFVTDWAFTTNEILTGEKWFPEPKRAGEMWARGISHGPDEDFETLSKVIFAALAIAKERVRIVSPYFLPDSRLVEALSVAALRGVDVEIYLPSNNNIKVVEWAATAQLPLILDYGCRVFITPPPFDHTKLMIVDNVWSLIGSTNWDPRSLRLNFEFNIECYDRILADQLNEVIDTKAIGSHEIKLDEIKSRSLIVQLRDGLSRLLSPYL